MQLKCLGGSQWKPEVTRAYDPGSFFVSLSLSLFYFLIINSIPPGSSPLKDPNNNEWKYPHHLHLHHPLTHTKGARCRSLWLHDKLQAALMHPSQTVWGTCFEHKDVRDVFRPVITHLGRWTWCLPSILDDSMQDLVLHLDYLHIAKERVLDFCLLAEEEHLEQPGQGL